MPNVEDYDDDEFRYFDNYTIEDDEDQDPDRYIPGPMDSIVNPNSLHESFTKCRQGVWWKTSVQRYAMNELSNIVRMVNEVEGGTYYLRDPYEFVLNERGHNRYIKALAIYDRVLQRSFNDNVLNPAVHPRLIYDNGASQKGKGISFSRSRFKQHLQGAYKEFGETGYVMFIDFSKYFDNILHELILEQFKPLMTPEEYSFLQLTYKSFDIDISYLSPEERANFNDTLFNMLEYHEINKELLTGEAFAAKSVGIGNQTSQASGIFYCHEMDNYCKIVKRLKYYGRYMDDTYVFMQTKEELVKLYGEIELICNKLGIHINPKKTKFIPITAEMTYLKINYRLLPKTGRVLELIPSHIFKRERHSINCFYKFWIRGKMQNTEVLQNFLSWEGCYKHFDSSRKVYEMELYFKDLFMIFRDTDLHELLLWQLKVKKEMDNNRLYIKRLSNKPIKYVKYDWQSEILNKNKKKD